jgi:hypothetical protein
MKQAPLFAGWTTGIRSPVRAGLISSLPHLYQLWAVQWVPGVERPEQDADNSPPSGAEVKDAWIFTCIPPYVFMVQCLSTGTTWIFAKRVDFYFP